MNRRFKFQGLIEDCYNQGTWIYDRINSNKKPIDIALIGTSHTINGVDDELIEKSILDTSMKVVNFGYCRLGRNMSFTLLKEILHNKKPKYVLIEVNEDEDRYSHNIFPMMSTTSDVLSATPFFNRDLISDYWNHFTYKVEITQDQLFMDHSMIPVYREEWGYSALPDTATSDFLIKVEKGRSKPKTELTEYERNFHMKYPRFYLDKIHKLCDNQNIKLVFYFLPSYGTYVKVPKEISTYKQYGPVIIPTKEILSNPNYWYDENHFNQAGASAYSKWLAKQIDTFILEDHKP